MPTPYLSETQRKLRSEIENLSALVRAEAWQVASEQAEFVVEQLKHQARLRLVRQERQTEIHLNHYAAQPELFAG